MRAEKLAILVVNLKGVITRRGDGEGREQHVTTTRLEERKRRTVDIRMSVRRDEEGVLDEERKNRRHRAVLLKRTDMCVEYEIA